MRLADIPTPALCVDVAALERNITRMALRPAHHDPTVNLHDRLYALRGEDVVAEEGRG